MSHPLRHTYPHMKSWMRWCRSLVGADRVIVTLGSAVLLCSPEGEYRLVGGTEDDRLAVREWVRLFHHEAVWREDESQVRPTPNGSARRRRLVPRATRLRLRLRDRFHRCLRSRWTSSPETAYR